jgi:predicted kinase
VRTARRELATRLAAVRFTPDEWLAELGLDGYDEQRRDRLERLLWRHAQDLVRHGRSVILDYGF